MALTEGRTQGAAVHRTTPTRRSWPWPALCGAVAGAGVYAVARGALPDDAYITLGYARNLAESGHWGLLADRPSNTATSPLSVWLLAVGIVLTDRPVLAVGLVLVATLAATGWWAEGLRRELDAPRVLPYVVIGLLACSPLFVSTVGLEPYLGAAVLVGVARYAVAGHPVASGLLAGAAVLVRPDLAVPAVVIAFGLLRPGREWLRIGVVAAAVALPWHLVAWRWLGGFLPDTVWFKTDGSSFPGAHGGDPMPLALLTHYGPGMPWSAGLVAAVLVAGCVLSPLGGRVAMTSAAAGAVHLAALAVLGTTPYLWYLAPALACSTLSLAIVAARVRPVLVLAAVLAVGSLAVSAGGAPWERAPMFANSGSAEQYLAAGADLAQLVPPGSTASSPGEIGTLAFACRCSVIDHFSDQARAAPYLRGPAARLSARYRLNPGPARPTEYRLDATSGPIPTDALGVWPVTSGPVPRWLVLRQASR